MERAQYWLSVGAQPSDRVAWLFAKMGLVPEVAQRNSVNQLEVPKSIRREIDSK